MTQAFALPPGAMPALAAFLSANLPRLEDDQPGWDHMFSTAYQIGCAALVALGRATETPSGAVPLDPPRQPDPAPRDDDLCIAALWLAEQQGLVTYTHPDGSLPAPGGQGFRLRPLNPPAVPAPDILPANGLGAARAGPEMRALLAALGLVQGPRWTAAAELLFWRVQPGAWGLDPTLDPRFAAAVDLAVATLPSGLRATMDRLTTVTAEDLAADLAQRERAEAAADQRFGPGRRRLPAPTPEGLVRGIEFSRTRALDDLFFAGWRLPDGWLSPDQARAALHIFHDPLAIAMRRAVVARVLPDRPRFAA